MNPCLLISPMMDTLYPSRLMTMGDFPQSGQWLTPDSTPYTTFDGFEALPANTLPMRPAFEPQGPSYLQNWNSPQALSPVARDQVYNAVAGASANPSGLGISNSVQYSPLPSTVSAYPNSRDSNSVQGNYMGGRIYGQGQAMVQTGLPPTPQTGGLTPEGSFRPRQPSPTEPRPSSSRQSRQSRQHKRLRPKGGQDERPALKRRRSSSTSQTSQVHPNTQAIQPEARAEMERKKEFFEGLRSKGVPWKDIVKQYEIEYGKSMTQAALQMERKRVKDSLRVWTGVDVKALESAHEYYETHKFSIIAEKMQEFGAEENWSPRQCQKKWEEMLQSAQEAALTPIPQPTPVRRAPTVPAPERWMQQGYEAVASSRVSPVSASNTISPSSFANTPLNLEAFNGYQQ